MIRKPKFKPNWKYALSELLLIFLGISLAIWFNNWNDEQKRDRLEQDILKQVYKDVLANKGDIDSDLIQLEFGLESHLNIDKYIREDAPYADSMCFDFYWLKKDEYTFPIRAGYENLKAAGLDLIKNDSILQLIQYTFESGYTRISRSTPFYPDLDQYYTEFYKQHFLPNKDMKLLFKRNTDEYSVNYPYLDRLGNRLIPTQIGYVPHDFEALKKNPEFLVMLRQSFNYRTYKVRQYQRVQAICDQLLSKIEKELGEEVLNE